VLLTWEYAHRHYVPVWLSPAMAIPERFRYCLAGCQWIDAHSQPPEQWLPQLIKAFKALGVDTKSPAAQPGEPTPGRAAETDRRVLRFRPGDRPIRGADWELERLLGKGGFGEVWKAYNPDLLGLPPVELKFCTLLDDRSKGLLRHEADMVLRAQRQIRSDGIVPLLHAYLNNDPPCLEYPYIEGGTLVRLIDECRQSAGSFKPAQAQGVIQRVAQIVGAAHRATPKLVHRDLKPSNILVERLEDGKIVLRVTDFGIGGVAAEPVLERSRSSSSLAENMASVLTGSYSPLYASPPQMRGDKPDPRDDVYALGVIWYQLLTTDLTSPAPTGRRWVDDLRKRGMSDAAVDLLSSCFESAPAHRPDDAGVLAELLQAPLPSTATKPAGSTTELPLAESESSPALGPSQPRPVVDAAPAEELVNSIGMKLKLIPAGEFQMGSTEADDEKPRHLVTISRPFYLGVYPVTQREYVQIARKNPSHFSSGDRLPVENVSWFDALAFCNALSRKEGLTPFYAINGESVEVPDWNGPGYRLPTEAEWEYACRAGSTTRFSFGDDENALGQYAWYNANSSSQTHAVGEKKPNAFGLHDMLGNVVVLGRVRRGLLCSVARGRSPGA
jgi:formylglycine-generating enzyme required for sulfatase activity